MKKIYFIFLSAVFLVFSACDKVDEQEDFAVDATLKSAQKVMNFRAHLSGGEEVAPVETMATGEAIFMLSKDGMTLHYKLIVANIENVRMSHIHLAPMGTNGNVVVWLYPSAPPPMLIEGTFNGVLAEGDIMAENLTGPMAGHSVSALVDSMKIGKTYVNVHTIANPGGEIRGQIK